MITFFNIYQALKSIQDNNEADLIIKSSVETLLCPGQTVNHYSEAAVKLLNLLQTCKSVQITIIICGGVDDVDGDDDGDRAHYIYECEKSWHTAWLQHGMDTRHQMSNVFYPLTRSQ